MYSRIFSTACTSVRVKSFDSLIDSQKGDLSNGKREVPI